MIAALWLMLFVSFILSQSGEDQYCTAPPERLDLAQNTHLCFLGGRHKCIWPSCLVQNNCFLLGKLLLCPLNLCAAGMKEMALVFISHVNYWYQLLSGWRWENVSSRNGHIAQTCCLGHGREEGKQEQNWNVLIVNYHHLFTTAVPRLANWIWLHLPRPPLAPVWLHEHLLQTPQLSLQFERKEVLPRCSPKVLSKVDNALNDF